MAAAAPAIGTIPLDAFSDTSVTLTREAHGHRQGPNNVTVR
jgi:hypothetical protein